MYSINHLTSGFHQTQLGKITPYLKLDYILCVDSDQAVFLLMRVQTAIYHYFCFSILQCYYLLRITIKNQRNKYHMETTVGPLQKK